MVFSKMEYMNLPSVHPNALGRLLVFSFDQ